jgi:hypothetical protein
VPGKLRLLRGGWVEREPERGVPHTWEAYPARTTNANTCSGHDCCGGVRPAVTGMWTTESASHSRVAGRSASNR